MRYWNRVRSTPPGKTTSRTVKLELEASPGRMKGLYWSPRNPAAPPPNFLSIALPSWTYGGIDCRSPCSRATTAPKAGYVRAWLNG